MSIAVTLEKAKEKFCPFMGDENFKCLGNQCMAWTWVRELDWSQDYPQPLDQPATHGYCGRAMGTDK